MRDSPSKTRIAAGLVALVWLGLAAPVAAAQDRLPADGVVVGTALDLATRRPLAGVVVRMGGRETLTDEGGRFGFRDVPAGAYLLEVELLGYRPRRVPDVMVRPARATTVEVELEVAPVALPGLAIRPSYFPELEAEPAGRFGYGAEEVRRAPGSAGDVSRILMSLPSVAKVNDQSNGLVVRGGSPLENLFVVDGIEIPNVNHFPTQGASGGPISLLNVDLIHGVELFAGAFPARFGDRLSSVLDIRLREGNREATDLQVDLSLAGFGGVAEGPLGGLGSWLVSARRSYLDLLVRLVDVGATVAPRYGDYQGKVVYTPAPGHRVTGLAIWADDRMRSDLEQAREHAMLHFGRQSIVQGTTGLGWDALWTERVHTSTSIAHTLVDYDEAFRDMASDLPLLDNQSREQWLRLRNETRVQLPGGAALRVGGDAGRLIARYDNVHHRHIGPLGDTVPEHAFRDGVAGVRWGLFATVTTPLAARLTASLGVRADGFGVTAGGATLSPRGSLAYRLGEATMVSASAGVYRQTLPAVLLAQSSANRGLEAPRSIHYVLGLAHLIAPDTRLLIEAYRKDYDRLPMSPARPGLFPLDELFYDYGLLGAHPDLVDAGVARSEGVEAVLRKRLSGTVYGLASGAVVRARYRGLDEVWRNRAVDNRFVLGFEGGWRPSHRWELSGRWIFAGGPPFTPIDESASRAAGRAVLDADRINLARYPDYHSLNLRVDRRFPFRRSMLVAYLSAWNVYDRENIAAYYWHPEEERVAGIRQWGLLPIFGLEYEF